MDIVWVGANGSDHLFHFLADGNRPVLEIYVDENDPEGKIRINGYGHPLDNVQETLGRTHTEVLYVQKNGVDGLERRICVNCIATYIVPRIATMMARAYVPKDANVTI